MLSLLALIAVNGIIAILKPALRPNLSSFLHACIISYMSIWEPSLLRLITVTAECFLLDTVASLLERRHGMILHHLAVLIGTVILYYLLQSHLFSIYGRDIELFIRAICGFERSTILWSFYNGYRQYYGKRSDLLLILFACVFAIVRLVKLPSLIQIFIRCYEPTETIYYACLAWFVLFASIHLYWPIALIKSCRRSRS